MHHLWMIFLNFVTFMSNMDKTVAVVMEWAKYAEMSPAGSLEDFCRHYLSEQRVKEFKGAAVGSEEALYACQFDLSRVINRLSKLWMHFTLNAMKPMGLTSFDEFIFLMTVERIPSIRKKDLIYMHYIEISSGILIIDRLIKKALLEETMDELDKRSKKLTITQKGSGILAACHEALHTVQREIYGNVPEKDMQFCLELLAPIEARVGQQWFANKRFEPVKLPPFD